MLEPGLHRIHRTFRGAMSEAPHGLYARDDYAVTQLQPAYARTLFPCFDEPRFKATFDLTVIADARHRVIANTPAVRDEPLADGRHAVTFATTPPMPPYLLGIAIGLEPLRDELVLAAADRARAFYETLHPYPWPKLDLIAVPELEAAGIETTGTIFFREEALRASRSRVASLVAHEVAHQWFGSLVTPASWDELWLSEGFATWLAAKAVAPELRDELAEVRAVRAAMAADSLGSSRALVSGSDSPKELFDPIAYNKGAAVLRMLEAWLGEETFLRGVRLFLSRHAHGSVTSDDLWRALEEVSGQPVAQTATPFVTSPGVPRVTFDATGAISPPVPFPVTVKQAGRGVFGNAGATGYYRCSYARPRDIDPSVLTPAEQFTLLDDAWADVWDCRSDVLAFLRLIEKLPRDVTRDHAAELRDLLGRGRDVLEWAAAAPDDSLESRLANPATRAEAWDEVKQTWTPGAFGGGAVVNALGSFSDAALRNDVAAFFGGRGEERLIRPIVERIDSRIRFREREQRKFDAWLVRRSAPSAVVTDQLRFAHGVLNALIAGFHGAATSRALLDRFGVAAPGWMHPAADVAAVANGLESLFLQLFRGQAMVDSRVIGLAARLREDLLATADLVENAPSREIVVALLARLAVVREHFLTGLIAFADLFDAEDEADRWRAHLAATDQDVHRARTRIAGLLAGADDPDLRADGLAQTFRAQAADLAPLAS
jgi:hypothetical protein